MTAKEIQKRNEKAEQLKVLQSDDGQFFVESGEGKILYSVSLDDEGSTCTCGDFAKNVKKDSNFRCKHILSVMNAIPMNEVENARFLERQSPQLDPRFISNIKGKDFALYAGVLDLATQKGLLKLEVELVQFPSKENGNEAICCAVATLKTGEVFSDIGDANPNNCVPMIAKHLIRMASTRAKARALRDMCNIGMACLEELADFDDVIGGNGSKKLGDAKKPADEKKTNGKTGADSKTSAKPKTEKKEPVKTKEKPETGESTESKESKPKDSGGNGQENSTQPKMSEAQKRAIYNLSRRRGVSVEELETMAAESYGVDLESLSSSDAAQFIRTLQTAA